MAQLIVRGLEQEVVRELKRRAAKHGISAEAEHREILRAALVRSLRKRPLKSLLEGMPVDLPAEVLDRPLDLGREEPGFTGASSRR